MASLQSKLGEQMLGWNGQRLCNRNIVVVQVAGSKNSEKWQIRYAKLLGIMGNYVTKCTAISLLFILAMQVIYIVFFSRRMLSL